MSNSQNRVLVRIGTGIPIPLLNLNGFRPAVAYPHDFFTEKNPKPKLQLSLWKGANLEQYRKAVKSMVTGNAGSIEIILGYLYFLAESIQEQMNENWKSFHMVIPSGKVNPNMLLEILKKDDGEMGDVDQVDASAEEDGWLLISILSIARLERANDLNQRRSILTAIQNVLRQGNHGTPAQYSITRMDKHFFGKNQDFIKYVAAYDMFFHKFQKNKYASARVASDFTRFDECTALTSLTYIEKTLGFRTLQETLSWLFVTNVRKELDRMLLHTEELYSEFSYLPYFIAFGASAKSPYSAASNPALFLLIHVVGACFGNQRSINAFMPRGDILVQKIAFNAAIIILANREGAVKRSAPEWLTYYNAKNCAFSQDEWDYLQERSKINTTVRPKTVGEWMNKHFMGHIYKEAKK